MHLYCAKCGRQLTRDCRPGTVSDYNLECAPDEPTVATGIIVDLPLDKPEHAAERVQSSRVQHGAIVVNPASVLRSLLKSVGVDHGCCGSDGCDGPNRACICGAVLGTERSDCWTPAEIRFLPDAVIHAPHNRRCRLGTTSLTRAIIAAISSWVGLREGSR
jgi:hypothetical protein